MTKVDVTVDFKGSFIPNDHFRAQSLIKERLEHVIGSLIEDERLFFHNCYVQAVPTAILAENNLETCIQFAFNDV